ncbi:hypothetical protein GSI_14475 [Ganoderma sinense ZZ0214-1]|uniref:Uncharacterized protein n=1 Tax=Ganoderma sinense ZZ0214-1 TaxID=1077348 RepID=A0A2G8RNT1_9APHY|nr:hypothetical protein GSI_14475 [Ganoderma sinense ZZ0214-1]
MTGTPLRLNSLSASPVMTLEAPQSHSVQVEATSGWPSGQVASEAANPTTQAVDFSSAFPTDGEWWQGAYACPSTSQAGVMGLVEDLTLSIEAPDGDKGKGVDRSEIQLVSTLGPAAASHTEGFSAAPESHYAFNTQVEPSYYVPPGFSPQASDENWSGAFQPFMHMGWGPATGDSQLSYQWGPGW